MIDLACTARAMVAFLVVMVAAGPVGPTAAAGSGGPTPPGKALLPRLELLARFDTLDPAARLKAIEKAGGDRVFQAVVRGDVIATVVARGSLASAKNADVYCTVRAPTKGGVAATIKWLIDDGASVKKGELVAQLDDSGLAAQLKEQRIKLDLARADLVKAREDLDLVGKEMEASILSCDIDIRTAELALKKHANDDADEKDILRLHIERARLNLARNKALGKSRETHAQAVVEAKKAAVEVEQIRVADIEQQVAACRVVAPQDGIAVYFVPEQVRGGSQAAIVAVGEPVREGQRLLQIPDLTRMVLDVRVPEAFISRMRLDQKAIVRVDAFPQRAFTGRVQWIDNVALQADFFATDVKIFLVKVALPAGATDLRPGMSADVMTETGRVTAALVVPVQAVVRVGPKDYCYVKNGTEIRKADVTAGMRNDSRVEIKAGLKEVDEVLRDPVGLLRRVLLAVPAGAGPKETGSQPRAVHVRSVRLIDPDGRLGKKWVEAYGLTSVDLRAIAALPNVAGVVPVRRFPHESRHLAHRHDSIVVGATPELADMLPLPLEAGRFLSADDMRERRNVAVLGAEVAGTLFLGEDPLGQTIVLSRESYVVIGVLEDGGANDPATAARHASILVPLSTCRSRFGEKIILRSAGSRRAEAVELSDIYVTLHRSQDLASTVESIREMLGASHEKQDWAVSAAGR